MTEVYNEVLNWMKSFLSVEKKALLYEKDKRVIHYNEKNLIAYLYFLFSHSWYMFFLLVLYKDLNSLYLFILILFIILLFSKNLLPSKITEVIVLFIAISDKDESGLSTRIFSYSILLILFLSSYYFVYPLPYLRILFGIRTFIALSGFFYITHPNIALTFLTNNIIKDKELLDHVHPNYRTLTSHEVEDLKL
jgi:hypothetical protein